LRATVDMRCHRSPAQSVQACIIHALYEQQHVH
jgi:hypothetical protein